MRHEWRCVSITGGTARARDVRRQRRRSTRRVGAPCRPAPRTHRPRTPPIPTLSATGGDGEAIKQHIDHRWNESNVQQNTRQTLLLDALIGAKERRRRYGISHHCACIDLRSKFHPERFSLSRFPIRAKKKTETDARRDRTVAYRDAALHERRDRFDEPARIVDEQRLARTALAIV
jgi:hypothetical protein